MQQPPMSDSDIPAFYRGRSIFITGATGFMGKVLVERLLTTCPDVKNLYLLIREKKGVSPEKRLQQIRQSQAFDVLRANNASQLDKLVAISGDVSQEQFGLTAADKELLSEVSVVFHSAATVKLHEELKQSVNMNLRSVITLLELCDTLPKVDLFVHVSTAYSNADIPRVEEKVYPPPISLEALLDMVDKEDIDQEQVRKLIQSKPNTYTFTKAMAEHVVERHGCTTFSIAIFRPVIVMSSLKYPFPGWTDSLNGPSGVIAGASTGLLRILRSRGAARLDMVPVDIAIDNLIAAAWETAVDKPSQVRVYNCTSMENPITCAEFQQAVNVNVSMYPSSSAILRPHLFSVYNLYLHRILENLLQTIPLHTIEYLKRIVGFKKGRDFIQMNRGLQSMNKALEYFAVREWIFENYNARRLRYRLSRHDRTLFNLDPNTIDWKEVMTNLVRGTRRYVMREDEKNLVTARARIQIISLVYTATKMLFTLLMTLKVISHWLDQTSLRKILKSNIRHLIIGKN